MFLLERPKERAEAKTDRLEWQSDLSRAIMHTYTFILHCLGYLIKSLDSIVAILTIDKHGARKTHCENRNTMVNSTTLQGISLLFLIRTELTEERCILELLFCHDTRLLWKDSAEIKNIDTSLMISYYDCWSSLFKLFLSFQVEL